MLYMVTLTINIPQMLAYIPYMDPMGMEMLDFMRCSWKNVGFHMDFMRFSWNVEGLIPFFWGSFSWVSHHDFRNGISWG